MSLFLERFGTVSLPLIEAEQDVGAIGTRTAYFDLPGGGAFDAYGSDQAPRGLYSLVARGETLVDAWGDLVVPIDTLRALRGRHDKLYARMDDQSVRWVWARCRDIPIARSVDNVLYLASDLRFDVKSPVWNGSSHGAGWILDDGEFLDTGLTLDEATDDVFTLFDGSINEFTVENNGNATVTNAIIKITPGSAAITGFTFQSDSPTFVPQADFVYSGTIGVGQVLIIDCGAQSATIPTAITDPAVATDTELTVTNSSFFTTGHTVEVQLNNGDYHRTTVAGTVDTTHVTLTDAMPSAASIGNAVVLSAYEDIAFGDRHRIGSAWFWLEPGSTEVRIDIDSTEDGTATFLFSDGFE